MTAVTATPRGPMNIDATDWRSLSDAERLQRLERDGYAVLPDLIDAATIARIEQECADLPMDAAPYSPEQTFARRPPQWHSPAFAKLIGHPPMIAFLKQALGDDIVFMLGHYVRSGPGVPGLALHSDYQPYGSKQKGWNESSPATIRVLIYLHDLTPDRAPFTFLPRSHLSLHQASDPYLRFDNHPDMVTVCLKAGSAIAFNVRAFHGTHPHTGSVRRAMLEYAYRPAWARCTGQVEEWDKDALAKAPAEAMPYLKPRNSGMPDLPSPNFIGDASPDVVAGLSTHRWPA